MGRRFSALLSGWLLLYLGLPGSVWADEVPYLYEASVLVASQDREERQEAIRTALTEVLVRVSGRTALVSIPDYPGIAQALKHPTRYVQQYRYRVLDKEELKKIVVKPGETPPRLNLWVRFSETAINKLLRENHLPVWGRTRPATLVWLVVDNRGRRQLLSNDANSPVRQILEGQAQLRGLPLRLPFLDLTDRSALRVSDVWGNFEDAIAQASQRYQSEAILVGRVYQGYSGTWHARWTLYHEGRRKDWDVRGVSLAEVLQPGVNKTAEDLAVRFAQVNTTGMSDTVLVQVKGVTGLPEFNRVQKYLASLNPVKQVQPFVLRSDNAIFRLTSRSGRLGVSQAIALGHTLMAEPYAESVPVTAPAQSAAQSRREVTPDLVYRLLQ